MGTVYRIIEKETGRVYIGSTTQTPKRRWQKHLWFLEHQKHGNVHLQRSYNRRGAGAFIFEPIEEAPNDQLIAREQFWIDHCKPLTYNLAPKAGGCWSMSQAGRERVAARASAFHTGRRRSAETRAKMSRALRGNTNGLKRGRQALCKRGHQMRGSNLVVRVRAGRQDRECRICALGRAYAYRQRRKAKGIKL